MNGKLLRLLVGGMVGLFISQYFDGWEIVVAFGIYVAGILITLWGVWESETARYR
jgi:hypothetical protein